MSYIDTADIFSHDWVVKHATSRDSRIDAEYRYRDLRKYLNNEGVLDIGCGSGLLVDLLAKRGYPAMGIDNSPICIEYAITHHSGRYNVVDNLRNMDDRFGTIILSHVLEHVETPLDMLLHIRQLLLPGGYIYVAVPNKMSYKAGTWREQLGLNIWGSCHLTDWKREQLVGIIRDAGFNAVEAKTHTAAHTIMALQVSYIYRKLTRQALSDKPVVSQRTIGIANEIFTSPLRWLFSPLATLSQQGNKGAEIVVVGQK